jgi:Fe-S-cluster containining protein
MSDDKMVTSAPDECQRCGTCCRQGGPALHAEDRHLFETGVLKSAQLVTVRTGEPAHDPLQDAVLPAVSEFIKIGGQGASWSCSFLEELTNNCQIYRQRPLECRLLFWGDTEPLEKVIGKDLLTRNDLVGGDDPVLVLIDRLEDECPYQRVNEILADADNADQTAFLTDLARRDLAIRQAFLNHFPDREKEELFLFGRPLFMVLGPYGYKLVEKGGGLNLEIVDPKA